MVVSLPQYFFFFFSFSLTQPPTPSHTFLQARFACGKRQVFLDPPHALCRRPTRYHLNPHQNTQDGLQVCAMMNWPPTVVVRSRVTCQSWSRISKRFVLSSRLFSKATEFIYLPFKSLSPVSNVEIMLICH